MLCKKCFDWLLNMREMLPGFMWGPHVHCHHEEKDGKVNSTKDVTALIQRVKDLECLLCISHDYLLSHWDMGAEPLRKIDNVVKEILREDK